MLARDELQKGIPDWYLPAGPMLLFVGGIFGLAGWSLRKDAARQGKLRDYGVILNAVLTKAEEDRSEDSAYNVRCCYQFQGPNGRFLTGASSGYCEGIKKKNMPAAGTKLLVIYVDEKIHKAL